MRCILTIVLLMGLTLCRSGAGTKEIESIRREKRDGKQVILIDGKIRSRHARFQKGKSVKSYYIVTPEMLKIPLPRSHVEHRDGTISGIYLKSWKGKQVQLVCSGRVRKDDRDDMIVTVEKIISLAEAKG